MMIKDEGNTLVPGQRIRKVQVLSRSKKKTEPKQLQTKGKKKLQRNNMEKLGRKSN